MQAVTPIEKNSIKNTIKNTITLAFTGASGAQYGLRLLEMLVLSDNNIILLISKAGLMVLAMEMDLPIPSQPKKMAEFFTELYNAKPGQIVAYAREDWTAPVASGSGHCKTMVICPCTTGCLAAIALGTSDNLLERAADVIIKEQGKLILVVREMPLSAIHLEHMLSLSKLGVTIMPACPGFYFKPQNIQDIIDFVVARILDQLNIQHELLPSWGKK